MRQINWRRRRNYPALAIFLERVWSLRAKDIELGRVRPEPYADHYLNILEVDNLLATRLHGINESWKVADVVDVVKSNVSSDIVTTVNAIKSSKSIWASTPANDAAARSALELACKLWLFSKPSLEDHSRTLIDANKALFSASTKGNNATFSDLESLSADFSAKNLERKGGFYLVWTSNLSEHLTFASKDQLRVFRHAHALRKYQDGLEK